jgi:hypothetical protein
MLYAGQIGSQGKRHGREEDQTQPHDPVSPLSPSFCQLTLRPMPRPMHPIQVWYANPPLKYISQSSLVFVAADRIADVSWTCLILLVCLSIVQFDRAAVSSSFEHRQAELLTLAAWSSVDWGEKAHAYSLSIVSGPLRNSLIPATPMRRPHKSNPLFNSCA